MSSGNSKYRAVCWPHKAQEEERYALRSMLSFVPLVQAESWKTPIMEIPDIRAAARTKTFRRKLAVAGTWLL